MVQTLLQLGDMRAHGRPTVPVEAGVGFSAWLDMVGSSPTYDSLQTCDNNCQGIGTQIYLSSPSGSRKQHDCCWASGLHSSKSASNNRAGRALRHVLGAALRQVAADQPPDHLALAGHAGAAARTAATHARACAAGDPLIPTRRGLESLGVAAYLAALVDLLIVFVALIACLSSLWLCFCVLTTCALPTLRR